MYDETETFKVNDIVEFVGVLSVDPCLATFHYDRYVIMSLKFQVVRNNFYKNFSNRFLTVHSRS